jgi:hypothetical protein
MKIKNHVLTQGNINDNQLDIAIAQNYPNGIDFCYTDPPWGNGNLKYWDTMNKKMNQVETDQIDQERLENRCVELICKNVKHYAFIVYGVREAESLMLKLKAQPNVTDIQYIEKKYRSGAKWLKNCVIAVTLNSAPKENWTGLLTNQDGRAGLHVVAKMFKGKYQSVMDCFIGQGFYLETFNEYGFDVIGNELNQARLTKAISRIT